MNPLPEVHGWRASHGLHGRGIIILVAAVIVLGAVILLAPIKVPYNVKTFCQVQPVQRWILTSGAGDQLLTVTIDYRSGVSTDFRVSQFAREGTMKFSFHSRILAGEYVRAGDTVATIYSSETEQQMADLTGQLAAMRASLTADASGEKEPVIRQYEALLAHAEEKAANQRRIVERVRALHQRQMVTQEEFEIAESEYRLMEKEIEIARAQLETVRTGAKPESIALLEANIAVLTDDLNALHERLKSFSVVSPISGRISRTYSADTLLIVSDTSAYVALIPITVNDVPYVAVDQSVSIKTGLKDREVNGRLLLLDTKTQQLKRRQVQIGTALIAQSPTELPLGVISPCVVRCGSVSIIEYIKRLILSM